MYMYICIYIYVCMYVCTYVCMHICIYQYALQCDIDTARAVPLLSVVMCQLRNICVLIGHDSKAAD